MQALLIVIAVLLLLILLLLMQVGSYLRETLPNKNGREKTAQADPVLRQSEDEEDWLTLWASLSESAKRDVQRSIEDDQLRQRAQELGMWRELWYVAPEETRERIQERWKATGIPLKRI